VHLVVQKNAQMTFKSQEPEYFHRFWHENEKPAEYPVRSPEVHVFLEQGSSSQSCLNGLRCSIFSICSQVVVDILSPSVRSVP